MSPVGSETVPKRHDQQAIRSCHAREICNGELARIIVKVMPDSAKGDEIKHPRSSRLGEFGKLVIQPLNPMAIVQRHSSGSKLLDRFDREHMMTLPSEPRGVTASSCSYIRHSHGLCRQEVQDRRIHIVR